MTSKITAATSEDMMSVTVTIESDCPMVRKMSPITVNPYETVPAKFVESPIYEAASQCIAHGACPVPCAIVKCIEVEGGLALKKPVSIEFE